MNSLITRVSDMDRAFDQLWGSSCRPLASSAPRSLRPRVDIEETDAEFRVRMDLPGVKRDDLKVELEKDTLLIEAERKAGASDDVQVLHRERASHARFSRRFSLGESVRPDGIVARLVDGVLELTLPKAEKALPRRINVE
jgi:HSP20 family protein